MRNKDTVSLIVEVARLYYQHDLNQQEISNRLGISRPAVSRLLSQARQNGIVRIEIIDPDDQGIRLERELKSKFNLKHVIIVPNHNEPDTLIKKRMGKAAADYLDKILNPGNILGLSWGTTMLEFMRAIQPHEIKNMTVVQLNGGVSRAEFDTHAGEVTQNIAQKYQAIPFLLPLPAIVDNADVKNAIISDKNISRTLKLAHDAQIAIYTIGSFGFNSVLHKADYFSRQEVSQLLKEGAVADICSRIINTAGNICSDDLNKRTIGIDLSELQNKQYAIAVAGGENKFKAIKAALRGSYFNVLITDEIVGKKLIDL